MTGRLIAFVGPSGSGKDTLMRAVAAVRPGTELVRRVITRPAEAGGEAFEAVTDREFRRLEEAGAFALHWQAHGLCYGIPRAVRDQLGRADVLVNLSRSVLAEAAAKFPGLLVVNLTVQPDLLARRLAARGRETAAEIAARLTRQDLPLPAGVAAVTVSNDGSLEQARDAILALLQPVRG